MLRINVTRSGGATGAVGVNYATVNGSATAGQDYSARSGTLSWDDRSSVSRAISIPITSDSLAEGGETFTVVLSNPTGGALLGTATATVTIVDDEPTPAGGAFKVNTYTTDDQSSHSVASDAQGNFVIAWMSKGQDGSDYGIYAQRYAANGTPQGSEFSVNTTVASGQVAPSVASDAQGNFVVTWQSGGGQDGSGSGIYAQRYAANGAPLGSEFQVNSYTVGEQWRPSIASDAQGNFVITWVSDGQDSSKGGIYAQRYAANGAPLSSEFRVNAFTYGAQFLPDVASGTQGSFVVTWVSSPDDSGYGIYAQRYAADGTPLGSEFRVSAYTQDSLRARASVTADALGNFIVTWMFKQPGATYSIYARRYSAEGTSLDGEFTVSTTPIEYIYSNGSPSIASDIQGNFVIIWQAAGSGQGIYAQRYAANGSPLGGAFRVNSYMGGPQVSPAMASDAMGNIVITWEADGQDGSGYGIYAQRYRGP